MEDQNLRIITTVDGSASLYNERLKETYHSFHGALQESKHVFIKNGLEFWCKEGAKNPASVLEVGMGTGLNALLTYQFSQATHYPISYLALEPYPIPLEIVQKLNYPQMVGGEGATSVFNTIHNMAFESKMALSPEFEIIKTYQTLENFMTDLRFDIIFFDAFAPKKQPEMWTIEHLQKLADYLHSNGVLVTYCAMGQLKRDLKTIGLTVETLDGPPGKKEMVRAVKR